MRAWLVVAALTLSGCVLDDLDLEGRPCPCSDGYQCVDAGGEGVCASEADSGTGPDAGAGDASRRDGGTACAGTDLLFCDGFEDSNDEGKVVLPWLSAFETNGSTEVVAEPVRTGGGALSAETTAAGGQAAPLGMWGAAVSAGDLWARAWLRAPGGQAVSGVVPLSVGDSIEGGFVHGWLGSDDRLALVVGNEIPPTVSLAATTYPRDEWFCLRLHVVVSNAANSAELFIGDGDTPAARLSDLDTRPGGDFSTVLVGVAHAQPDQGPVQLFVDDVVVDTEPVSCAAP